MWGGGGACSCFSVLQTKQAQPLSPQETPLLGETYHDIDDFLPSPSCPTYPSTHRLHIPHARRAWLLHQQWGDPIWPMGALRSAAKGPSRSERPGHRRAGHHKRLLRDKGSETAQAWFLCNNVIYSLPNRVQTSHNNNKKNWNCNLKHLCTSNVFCRQQPILQFSSRYRACDAGLNLLSNFDGGLSFELSFLIWSKYIRNRIFSEFERYRQYNLQFYLYESSLDTYHALDFSSEVKDLADQQKIELETTWTYA